MSGAMPVAPPAVRWIVHTLEEAGFETWAVGGAVRDAITGRPPKDEWDLATRARPEEVRRVFRRTVPIGVEHGTVGVLSGEGTMYEVTTFRRDVETDGRHAVVSFADTIEEDLGRRDFTINALAWHPLREELIDPYGGATDLERRVLRTVGEPAERFREDYLRILRGLRFAGLFGLTVDEETWASLFDLTDQLTGLSAERVREELLKVLGADPTPTLALELYAESGALAVLYPELDRLRKVSAGEASSGSDLTKWEISVETVQDLPVGRPLLRLAALLRELEPADIAALLVRLKLSNAVTDETARRAGASPMPAPDAEARTHRRWLSATGPERLAAVARLDLARAKARRRLGLDDSVTSCIEAWGALRGVRRAGPPLQVGDLALDGRDLIRMGLKPGPHFGKILDALLDQVLDDPARNHPDLLAEAAAELAREVAPNG